MPLILKRLPRLLFTTSSAGDFEIGPDELLEAIAKLPETGLGDDAFELAVVNAARPKTPTEPSPGPEPKIYPDAPLWKAVAGYLSDLCILDVSVDDSKELWQSISRLWHIKQDPPNSPNDRIDGPMTRQSPGLTSPTIADIVTDTPNIRESPIGPASWPSAQNELRRSLREATGILEHATPDSLEHLGLELSPALSEFVPGVNSANTQSILTGILDAHTTISQPNFALSAYDEIRKSLVEAADRLNPLLETFRKSPLGEVDEFLRVDRPHSHSLEATVNGDHHEFFLQHPKILEMPLPEVGPSLDDVMERHVGQLAVSLGQVVKALSELAALQASANERHDALVAMSSKTEETIRSTTEQLSVHIERLARDAAVAQTRQQRWMLILTVAGVAFAAVSVWFGFQQMEIARAQLAAKEVNDPRRSIQRTEFPPTSKPWHFVESAVPCCVVLPQTTDVKMPNTNGTSSGDRGIRSPASSATIPADESIDER